LASATPSGCGSKRCPRLSAISPGRRKSRLCGRYRRLSAAGKKLPVIIAAIAREMAAFLWAIGRQVAPAPLPDARLPAKRLRSVGDGATEGNSRRWLCGRVQPDARPLDRGKPRDEDTEGGTQAADKSLINRRLDAPSPALRSSHRHGPGGAYRRRRPTAF